MKAFLRLFSQFRELEADYAALVEEHSRLSQEKLLLQDRLDASQGAVDRLWAMTNEALAGERTAYQAHINQAWQRSGGGIPYPEAPHLPASAVPKEQSTEPIGRRGRVLPSEVVQQRTSEYIESLARSVGK